MDNISYTTTGTNTTTGGVIKLDCKSWPTTATTTTYTVNTIPYTDFQSDFYNQINSYFKLDNSTPKIVKVEELCPNKVMRFTFSNKKVIKTICNEYEDFFDFEYAFYLAYAKLLYGQEYTIEGIEHKAQELSYQKKFVKLVKDGIKVYEKGIKEKQEKERLKKEEKARNVAMNEKKRKKNQKARNARIAEMAEAFKLANTYVNLLKED